MAITIISVILAIFAVFLLLSIWEVRGEAKKTNTKLGFWGSIVAGVKNLFARLVDAVLMNGW